jgi:hypothetical protein
MHDCTEFDTAMKGRLTRAKESFGSARSKAVFNGSLPEPLGYWSLANTLHRSQKPCTLAGIGRRTEAMPSIRRHKSCHHRVA